jgi:toxin ParE1/3/4
MTPYYRVILLPEVYDDINRIIDYILPNSPENAAHVADIILNAAKSLSSLPKRYAVHQHRKDPDKTTRAMPVSSFILYYRIIESHRAVKVLTVRHGARRQPRGFK